MFARNGRTTRRPWWRLRARRALPGVLSASELEAAFRQERARVDRNGRCFSVVVCTVNRREPEDLARTAAVLVSRMRTYDSLGSLDGDRLALLLPESDGRGAWSFVDHALVQLGESSLRVDCEVFTYPMERGGRDGRGLRPVADTTPPDGDEAEPQQKTGAGASTERGPRRVEPAHGSTVTRGPHLDPAPGEDHSPRGTGTDGLAPEPRPDLDPEARLAAHAEAPEPPHDGLAGVRQGAGPRPVRDLYPLFLESLPVWRRVIDIGVSAVLLTLLLPLFVVVAAAVKLSSPGPVLFVQWRAGRGGRPFRFYKFRSMYADAEARKAELSAQNEHVGPIFKMRADPRITPVGRWIRRASIDEMPQLWNVLIGDMTLVGPRPPTLDEVAAYERWQRERLDITGGLTCIWQVSGRSEIGFEEWVRMDLTYKRKRSPLFDVKLLWRTIGAVFTGRGAY